MVSNQAVTQRVGITPAIVAGLAVLLTAGCQTRETSSTPVAEPVAAAPRSAPTVEETAIEAALAREPAAGTVVVTAPAPAPTPGPVLNPNAPNTYVVKRGDTLWDISSMFLRDPWLWPEIWHVNPTVANPHLIYPGDTLTLVYGAPGSAPQIYLVPGNAVRVSPLVRSSGLDGGPIPTIPYKAIASFLSRPSLMTEEEVKGAPKIAVVRDEHLVGSVGGNVYIKGMKNHGPGLYSVVRVGEMMKDPETGRTMGYMGSYAASAKVDVADDKLTKALLVESAREAVAGDVLFAEDALAPGSDIIPHAPPANFSGQIMAVVDGVSKIGQYNIVAVNRGASQGLQVGHVLAIDQKGEIVPDGSCKTFGKPSCRGTVQLPEERAGTLLIFKTYDRMSYALVVETLVPVRVADIVRAP
jgi:LysM repeat protein